MQDMLEFIKSRRSTRKYKPDMIPDEAINAIVEAGRYAPCGGNNQFTHFIVIKNHEVQETLKAKVQEEFAKWEVYPGMYKSMVTSVTLSKTGKYAFQFDAPVLIITANHADYGNNMADCACALENMMLMANALDLGTCYVNQLKWLNETPSIVEYLQTLGLQENERVYGAITVGYPDTPDGLPTRTPLPRKGNPVTIIE